MPSGEKSCKWKIELPVITKNVHKSVVYIEGVGGKEGLTYEDIEKQP